MPPAVDRRRFWRALFTAPVIVQDGDGRITAELVDVSLNGALVEVPDLWEGRVGQPVDLEFPLSEAVVVKMSTTVAHLEGRRVGLKCEHVDLDSISHLRRLVELNSGNPELLRRELSELIHPL
ncbi:MAG: PilZ domain-containing protein [Burkholderiaceae bacterium]